MKQIKVIIKKYMVSKVIKDIRDFVNSPDVVVSSVVVFGKPKEMKSNIKIFHEYFSYSKRVKLEFVISDEHLDSVIDIIKNSIYTRNPDDGEIFVSSVDEILKFQNGERK